MPQPVFIISDILNIPENLRTENNIIGIPHPLSIDGTEYPNNAVPHSIEEVGQMLTSGKHTFETAVTPSQAYAEVYKTIPTDTPIFVICFSGKISPFHVQARTAAADFTDHDITVIETTFCPPGLALYALKAASLAREIDELEKLKQAVSDLGNEMELYIALFNLEYLHQTGRINAAKAFIGKMIKLVPIITTNNEGLIVPASKTRRIEKSLARICDLVEKDLEGKNAESIDVLVTYTGDQKNGKLLEEMAAERFTIRNSYLVPGYYSLLRYLGPDAAGLVYSINR